jgi:hypothetical protein
MSRKQTLWLGSTIWGAAFVVCGAFAFAMNQPLFHHYDYAPTSMVRMEATEQLVSTPTPTFQSLTFPTIEIIVPRSELAPAKSTPAAEAVPEARDIEQMNCANWRPLEQGGNSVRECQ